MSKQFQREALRPARRAANEDEAAGDAPAHAGSPWKRYLFLVTLAGGEKRRVRWSEASVEEAWQLAFAHLPDADKARVRGFIVLAEEP